MTDPPPRRGRARVSTAVPASDALLDRHTRRQWAQRFGVAAAQIDHDFVISHLLVAISSQRIRCRHPATT